MKLGVLIPSEEYRSNAGARIRYDRIAAELVAEGVHLELAEIAGFDPASSNCEAILISKCHDARSLIVANTFAGRGGHVGIDLFDDYFSQSADSRLNRYRSWLDQILPLCDFALCSTSAMAGLVEQRRPTLSVHVMNDPAPAVDEDALSGWLHEKLVRVRDERRIRAAWFGVGDNPNFPIGLSDLASFGHYLADLRASGYDVSLTVLTNARAMTAEGLALVQSLPVRTELREWSEEAELQVLKDAFVAFLPVNAQAFSTAKSLNRAITALSYGCQILSVGFPLYTSLAPLIYRRSGALLIDLQGGDMLHSPTNFDVYRALIADHATASVEAQRFAKFLSKLPDAGRSLLPLAVIHGHSTNADAHRLAQATGGLSVASPFCTARLEFDVIFRGSSSGLEMLVGKPVVERLRAASASQLSPAPEINGRPYLRVEAAVAGTGGHSDESWNLASLPFQMAAYAHAMRQIQARLEQAFGPCRAILSESSRLPFPTILSA